MITFDDDHHAPVQLTKTITTHTTEESSSQVHSDNTGLHTHLANHQPKDSENTSDSKNHEQSSGGGPSSSTSGSSDSKTPSGEDDDAPVLGLRFTNINSDQHSVDNTNKNTDDEEGDLLGDNLE